MSNDIKEVSSVEEFISFILKARNVNLGQNTYYRGESSLFPGRLPSLYREPSLWSSSERYYRLLMNEMGWDDYSDNPGLVRRMAELQHYGAKTRILDITSNPLVALYFAVENGTQDDENSQNNDDNQAGYVYFYGEKPSEEKFDTGHTIAIKTAMSLMSSNVIDDFLGTSELILWMYLKNGKFGTLKDGEWSATRKGSEDFYYFSKERLMDGLTMYDIQVVNTPTVSEENILSVELNVYGRKLIYIIKKGGKKLPAVISKEFAFNEIKNLFDQRLTTFMDVLNQRAKTKENLVYPLAIYRDLITSHIVLPSKDTDRVKQQQGAFIYPAFSRKRDLIENISVISSSINQKAIKLSEDQDEFSKIKIPPHNKIKIKKELAILGITPGFIYPDLQHLADSVLEKVKSEN